MWPPGSAASQRQCDFNCTSNWTLSSCKLRWESGTLSGRGPAGVLLGDSGRRKLGWGRML